MEDERAHSEEATSPSPRRGWVVRKVPLGQELGDDFSASTTPEERLKMMWPLALEAWALTGNGMPDYERHAAPVRKLFRGAS